MSHQQQSIRVYKAFDPFDSKSWSDDEVHAPTIPSLSQLQSNALKELTDTLIQKYNCKDNIISIASADQDAHYVTRILRQYAEDYGHTIHHIPAMVFRPRNPTDVSCLVTLVHLMNMRHQHQQSDNLVSVPVRIVIRGSGGNVQGAAQVAETDSELQILLDMSSMTTIYTSDDQPFSQQQSSSDSIWVDAGCTWLQVLEETEKLTKRPLVVPDYLGITIGGTCSLGGLGGDSIARGTCINNVKAVEVVTGTGDIFICSDQNEHSTLFNSVLGGMGQFGIITRICLNLESNQPKTRVYHVVSHSLNQLLEVTKQIHNEFITRKQIQTLQIFAIPNTPRYIKHRALFGKTEETLEKKIESFSQYQQSYIYMMELSTRYSDDSKVLSMSFITDKIAEFHYEFDLVYYMDMDTSNWDRRLHLRTIPALIDRGSWFRRHPWLNILLTEKLVSEIQQWLQQLDPVQDMGAGYIGIYPLFLANNENSSFLSIPNAGKALFKDKWIYVLVLGRDDLSGTEEGYQKQVKSNREIWDQVSSISSNATANAGHVSASLYPSCLIPQWCEKDWSLHFGAKTWERFKQTKNLYDPSLVFADTRSFGFNHQ